MKPVAVLIVACALGGGCFRDALLTTNPENDPFPGDPKPVPPGSPLERDIASGHRQYETALASFGKWSSDPLYGVKWCPTMVDASTWVPYRSKGHWAAAEPPPGSPYWVSDDDEGAWGIITTHHGWWVYEEPPGSTSRWCWVPGAESTPARVVWRTGDGYVAWAPEPPPTDPDCDAADNDDLEWVFELIGTLLDDALDWGVLTGGAAHTASVATRRSREGRGVGHGNGSSRVGPPRKAVAEARSALSSYVAAHPGAAKPSSSEARLHGGAPTDTTVLPPSMAILRTDDERRAVPVRVRSRGDAEAAVGGVSRACGRSGRGGIERASLVQLGVCRVERARVERLVGAVGELGRRRRRLRCGRLLGPRFVGAHFVRLLVGVQLVIALVERRRRVRRARRSGPHGRRSQVGSGRRRTVRCARSA